MALIAVVGVLVFGPEKLPEFARQAAQFIKTLRRMAEQARDDLGWHEVDPREVVRQTILDDRPPPSHPGIRPPVDPDAT